MTPATPPPGGMQHLLARADCRRGIPLADGSVHACITSPPYWGLRSYLDADDPMKGAEIGGERSPDEYVARMVAVFREVRRVLHPTGCAWINLGDSFAGSWGNQGRKDERGTQRPINGPMIQNLDPYPVKASNTGKIPAGSNLKPKDLCGIPWTVALALRDDGWYLRQAAPWVKRAAMPESVTDRPSSSLEYVFLLAKRPDYYFDAEAVRVPARDAGRISGATTGHVWHGTGGHCKDGLAANGLKPVAEARNRRNGDWWFESVGMLLHGAGDDAEVIGFDVPTAAFPGAHFATWPPKLVEPMILSSTSARGCCPACGAPWVRVVEREGETTRRKLVKRGPSSYAGAQPKNSQALDYMGGHGSNLRAASTLGWRPSCPCPPADPIPCTILDPFNGSGTTGVVALAHGRRYVGLDLAADYLAMARMRIERPHAAIRSARAGESLPLFDQEAS